jgi:HK97 family phage portal protein
VPATPKSGLVLAVLSANCGRCIPAEWKSSGFQNGSVRYLYREPDGRQTQYSQEQIFALRFTTEDGVKPIPTYRLFANVIGLAKALEDHASTYFGNGARPGVILESDNPIPVEAAEQLRQNWERIHRGADRAFRTCVLPNGVKAHELSGSNEAAQMLESRQFSVIEICRLFRVPPHLIQELTRSTYSNIEVQGHRVCAALPAAALKALGSGHRS